MALAEACLRRDLTDLGIGGMTLTIGNGSLQAAECKYIEIGMTKTLKEKSLHKIPAFLIVRCQHSLFFKLMKTRVIKLGKRHYLPKEMPEWS